MIILDTINKSLQVLLGGAVTTNQLPFTANYVDLTSLAYTPGSADGATNNTTAQTLVAAPAASTQRQVKLLTVYNADTVAATVTVRLNDNGTFRNLVVATLAVGDTLQYADGEGFRCINSQGAIKNVMAGVTVGTVTSFSSGDLTPLFQTSVATPTSTPAQSFIPIAQDPNLFYAGPLGIDPDFPTFRTIDLSDLPNLSSLYAPVGAITASGLTMSTARLLGRTTAGTGAIEEIQASTGLTLSSGALTVNSTQSISRLSNLTTNGFVTTTAGNGTLVVTSAAAFTSGTLTGITSFGLRSSGTGAFDVTLQNTENLTAARSLTLTLNDASRSISLGGNLVLGKTFTTDTNGTISFATTGNTSVTLPTTGTLATLAGAESLTNKKLGSLTTNGFITTTSGDGTLVVTNAAAFTSGTATGLTGLAIRDTSAAFDVTLAATSSTTLTAGRTLTIDMVNAARTIKFTGNPTLADWFDQSVKTTASPTFAGGTVTGGINLATTSGNVGIGTTAPGEILQLGGTTNIGSARRTLSLGAGGFGVPGAWLTASNGDKFILYDNASDYTGKIGIDDSGSIWIQSLNKSAVATNGSIKFYTGQDATTPVSTERMIITGSGNVGIGTTNPGQSLEVNGAIKTAAPSGGTAAAWKFGTVSVTSPTSPNRTIELDVGGTRYFLAAKTTND